MTQTEWNAVRTCACGHCDDAALVLVVCAECNGLYGQCAETESLTPSPAAPRRDTMVDPEDDCVYCGTPLETLRLATSDEIEAAGLRAESDYR